MSDVAVRQEQPVSPIHQLTTQAAYARALLENMVDILDGDDDLTQSTVEGETNLPEALGQALKRYVELKGLIAGLKSIAEQIAARGQRFEAQSSGLRVAICAAMEAGQMKKFEHPLGTLSLRPVQPNVVITNEADIPPEYWKPSDPKLDKKAVLDALKAKRDVPGASLSNGSVTVAIKLS